jgi:hypothetical protein
MNFIKTISIVGLILVSKANFAQANVPDQDCKEVGNYLYEHSGEVHNALYVQYNGIGIKKIKTFNSTYMYWASKGNSDIGYNALSRKKYFEKNIEKAISTLKLTTLEEQVAFDKSVEDSSFLDFKKEEVLFTNLFARFYCKKIFGVQNSSCRKNLKTIFNHVDVQRIRKGDSGPVTSLTLPSVLKRTLTSPDHIRLVFEATNSLMPLVLDRSYKTNKNIYSLLMEKSLVLDKSLQQREEIVWDIIGSYATRGASFEGYRKHLISKNTLYSYSVLFELFNQMHAFDSKRVTASNLFSLPNFGKNSCQFGKAYHFWMSAYLSRYLIKEGASKKEAFVASAAMGILYDFMGSGAPQRQRVRILKEKKESVYVKSIQQSLLFKVLGALHGVDQTIASKVDVDELYTYIRDNSREHTGRIYMKELLHMKNLEGFIQKTSVRSLVKVIIPLIQ